MVFRKSWIQAQVMVYVNKGLCRQLFTGISGSLLSCTVFSLTVDKITTWDFSKRKWSIVVDFMVEPGYGRGKLTPIMMP